MPEPEDDDDERRRGANIAVLAAVAILIVLGVILVHVFSNNLNAERCQEERRHDCDGTVHVP